ncbi:MAG: FG-GAP-like repeat-containing protein, partial [bacterium]
AGSPLRTFCLEPMTADLHYRGFSKVTRETLYSPHIPDYQTLTTAPKWRDLTGLYTKYGDVLPLLSESDSKYVIMNAGDEITIEFDAAQLPELPSGWKRDFIFYNDGWLKDGDLNTARGQTVDPLPFHGMTAYPYSLNESYPRDEEHLTYLQKYNTREITTEAFKRFSLLYGDKR